MGASWLSLNKQMERVAKLVAKGKLNVVSVAEYDDGRVIIVLREERVLEVKVIDTVPELTTVLPIAGPLPPPESPKRSLEKDKNGRVILGDGNVACRHCGKPCKSRGATRHEKKCNFNPENLPRVKPRKKRKTKCSPSL